MDGHFKREIVLENYNENDEKAISIWQEWESQCGGVVWDSAILMIKYLDFCHYDKSFDLKGKRMVELGAGTGALGISAAAFGAHVMLTDIKDQIELMKINVKENEEMIKAKNGSVCINEWNWGNFSNEQTDLFDWKLNTIDYILVCDCIYYEESVNDLFSSLIWLSSHGSEILLCYEERETKQHLINKFFQLLSSNNKLKITEIPEFECHPHYNSPDLHLFKIKLQK